MTGPAAVPCLGAPAATPRSLAGSPWAAFAVAAGSVVLVSVDGTVAIAAFPALRAPRPAAAPADLSWVLIASTILHAALLVPAGRVVDLRGAQPVFLAGLALASAACGLATGPGALVAARTVQAVSGALLSSFLFLLGLWGYPEGLTGLAVTPGPVMAIAGAVASVRLIATVGHRAAIAGGLLYAGAQLWSWATPGEAPD